MRLVLLLALATCTQDLAPAPVQGVRPPPAPAAAPAIKTLRFERGGLAVWRGQTCGCMWLVEVDVASRVMTATDPDAKPWKRTLDPGELQAMLALVDRVRSEPDVPMGPGADFGETLDIWDGSTNFEVRTNGKILRPAAAQLATLLDTAARWPNVP